MKPPTSSAIDPKPATSDDATPLAELGAPQRWLAVYVIVKHPGRAPYWMSVGKAFVNRDHSLNVRLDALPIDGQLHIRKPPDRPLSGQPVTEREAKGMLGRSG